MPTTRRDFLQKMGGLAAGIAGISFLGLEACATKAPQEPFFKLSLAQWSLHKTLFAKKMDTLDFPGMAKNTFGLNAVEYVNQFFADKANDQKYLNQLLARSKDHGVSNNLIMIDGEGDLCDPDPKKRQEAVERHYKWVDAAKFLGCASIRVNAFGTGSREAVQQAGIDGLGRLGEYAGKAGLNLLAENHGGYSSDAQWLATMIRQVNQKHVGTLADFTNWCIRREGENHWEGTCIEASDPYKGVQELMPLAKGVSAKTFQFDAQGNDTVTDYFKMMRIVKDSGFTGYVGIEYEGDTLPEEEGIHKTIALLRRVGAEIS